MNFYVIIITAAAAFTAFLFCLWKALWIFRQPIENGKLKEITKAIAGGAMAFLFKEYRVLIPFALLVAAAMAVFNHGALRFQSLSFLLGAFASAAAGFIGMKTATAANGRTTEAALEGGQRKALKMAFSGGSVMGIGVVGLTLGGLALILFLSVEFYSFISGNSVEGNAAYFQRVVFPLLSSFSLGASTIALFSRVGGGIFTKAADVGADLVGKVEAGIPEDHPSNPAVIADNVGDNVGDVAGMGADLFESFAGTLVGAMILGLTVSGADEELPFRLITLPLLLAALGLFCSVIGILSVRTKEGKNPQTALNIGTFSAGFLALLLSAPLIYLFIGNRTYGDGVSWLSLFVSTVVGLICGIAIGLITEYYTGTDKRPVRQIVKASETGSATNIITGLGVGMFSTLIPVLLICASIAISYALGGLYCVSLTAVGMLITLGIQLAVDAYGPIADNAGGLAVMAEYPKRVREVTDGLDAVGNTTAAIGKGFAIGSAALTAIILFSSFKEQSGVGDETLSLTRVPVLIGLIIGAMIPYLFSALAMGAIGKAAFKMIGEVRRQFREHPGILTGTEKPDYEKCVSISTSAALREMILPGLLATGTPIAVGFLGGIDMLMGLLVGVTLSGIVLALFMSNSGGAWDNAKKMIESGSLGGKGSEAHKASVVGDTVGDPFKDTAGPSLNILIKLMAVVSLVIAPVLKDYWG